MKFLAWFVGIVLVLVAVVYVFAFTSFGNSLVKPVLQSKIQEQTKLDSKLEIFSLSMHEFEILLKIDTDNQIHVKGNYSLFSQSLDVAYRVKLEKLQNLKALTNAPIQGSFNTDGTLKGTLAFMKVDGKSDVAKSDTTYHVELSDFNPTSIIAKVNEADLVSLLSLGGQKAYASASINLAINFKNITPHALDGDVSLKTKNGKLNVSLMKQDFKIDMPQTAFSMNLDAKLKGDDVDYNYIVSSNLANITSSGKVIPEPLSTDIKYNVDIQELAVLQPITNTPLRGAFATSGTVKGNKKSMIINGLSDVGASDTKYTINLAEFKPASVSVSMKNLKLAKVLYMVNQPHYADGIFSLDVAIPDARGGMLKGTIISNIKDGLLDSAYITQAYKFKSAMPTTSFKLATHTNLNGDIVDTKVDLDSSLATFSIKQARINLKDSSLVSDYIATIPNLDKLYFASERHLKGAISVNGELKKAKDLDLTIHSQVADGNVDAKLHNDDFHADLTSIQTLAALEMLIYPEIFKSSLNGVLDYNIAKAQGIFNAHLVDGRFTQNQMLTLVKQYGKVDMYVQEFKGDVSADINKENILATLNLNSNSSSIKTKNTKLNSKTKQIDSKIDIVANNNPLTITLKGDTSSPKVSIDVQKIIEKEATKAIQKEVGNLLKGLFK